MNTIEQLKNYDFNKISLLTPRPLQGGTYFSKVVENTQELLLQTPKIYTKKGIHRTEKKTYCDLLFDIDDSIFLDWIKKFEEKIREIIFIKRDLWFYDELTLEDIEYNWIDSIKSYKKKFLCRTHFNKTLEGLRIFNENGDDLTMDDLKPGSKIICILGVNGLKFNTTSFHLEFGIKQIMVLDDSNKFEKCLIKYGKTIQKEEIQKAEVHEEEVHEEEIQKEEEVQEEEIQEEDIQKEEVQEEEIQKEEVLEEEIQKEVHDAPDKEEKEEVIKLEVVETEKEKMEMNKDENVEQNVKEEITDFINEKEIEKKDLEKNEVLKEHVLEIPKAEGTMNLRDPNEIYLDIYKAAKEKARQAKLVAVKAYLEAKKIKQTYLIDEMDTSDDDSEFDDEVFSEK